MTESRAVRRVLSGAATFAAILAMAWIGYMHLGCHALDAIYMVVITIFGIGYGEYCPISEGGRIFTIFVIVSGTSSVLFTFGGFIQMMTEGELHRVLDQRRKTRDIASLRGHVVICGYNHIGQVLAHQLKSADRPFVIVDPDEQALILAEESGYRVCEGVATDEQTLMSAGVERAQVLATVLPSDADNLFITLTARGLNRELIIVARGDVPSTEKKLRQAGADHVVLPATISGMRMANLITQPSAVDFLKQSGERQRLNEMLGHLELQMDELTVSQGSELDGATIGDIEVKGKGIFLVVALRQLDGEIITQPEPSKILGAGDTLIVVGHAGDIPQFSRLYQVSHASRYRTGVRG
jgi:voltage-gated potassium channel